MVISATLFVMKYSPVPANESVGRSWVVSRYLWMPHAPVRRNSASAIHTPIRMVICIASHADIVVFVCVLCFATLFFLVVIYCYYTLLSSEHAQVCCFFEDVFFHCLSELLSGR